MVMLEPQWLQTGLPDLRLNTGVQIRELEKQIVRVRSRGPGSRGAALLAQGNASLPFIRHMSEQLVWHSNLPACSDMQRQRSQSDPTVPASLRRTSPVGREWEQLQGELHLQSRVGKQGRLSGEASSPRGSQALETFVGSQATPADTSLDCSETEQSHPGGVETVCSYGQTAHARGISTDPQADTVGEMQPAEGDLQPGQQQPGKHVSQSELSAAQNRKEMPGKTSAVQGLQAGNVVSQPDPTNCLEELATSPVEGSNGHGLKADGDSRSHSECGSSSGKTVANATVTGLRTTQVDLKEPSIAAGLHEERKLARQCEALADFAGGQSRGSAGAEDAEPEVVPPGPGAGSGRRSKPFAYGPRTQPAAKALPSSGIYGIAANGSAASTQTHHAQPGAGVPVQGSITPPHKPFAYGPRGLALHDPQPNPREDASCIPNVEEGQHFAQDG